MPLTLNKRILYTYWAVVIGLVLSLIIIHFFLPNFDADMSRIIRADKGPVFAGLMGFISWWGQSYMMILPVFVAAGIFYLTSFKREAFFTLSVFLADAINVGFKIAFGRTRPEDVNIFPKFQQASFPSGHVVHYVVFFGFILAVMLFNSRIKSPIRLFVGLLCGFLALGVSVARVYLGTHWATDVLAAYVLGLILLGLILQRYLRNINSRLSL
jgi:membrane-associated phospholipid phosphatase